MTKSIDQIFARYLTLLDDVDQWFTRCLAAFPVEIRCGQGCSGCCRSLFDITLLDAWLVRRGFEQLPARMRGQIGRKATDRLVLMRRSWPDFAPPFLLNDRPEGEWEVLMPDEDETPCVFLASDGRCLIYPFRPMTCRLHGLPLVEVGGEVLHEEWCTENFTALDPLVLAELQGDFNRVFAKEVVLMRELTACLFNESVNELDTLIPLAALMAYDHFDWRGWWERTALVTNLPVG